jgi:hypothetical protein
MTNIIHQIDFSQSLKLKTLGYLNKRLNHEKYH